MKRARCSSSASLPRLWTQRTGAATERRRCEALPEPRHAGLRDGSPVSPLAGPARLEARPASSERAAASISTPSADAPAVRRRWAFAARTGGAIKPVEAALTRNQPTERSRPIAPRDRGGCPPAKPAHVEDDQGGRGVGRPPGEAAEAGPARGDVLDAEGDQHPGPDHREGEPDAEADDWREAQAELLELDAQEQDRDGGWARDQAAGQAKQHDLSDRHLPPGEAAADILGMRPRVRVVLGAQIHVPVVMVVLLECDLMDLASGRHLQDQPRREGMRLRDRPQGLQDVTPFAKANVCRPPSGRTVSTLGSSVGGNSPRSARNLQRGGTPSSNASNGSSPFAVATCFTSS